MKTLIIMSTILLLNSMAFAQAPDTLWAKTYGGVSEDYGWDVQQSNDKGFIITGATSSFGAGGTDIYIIKTNENGDTSWTRTYGGINDDIAESIIKTYDGGYAIVGHTNSYGAGSRDIWLLKIDSQGDTSWTKTYGGSGDDYANTNGTIIQTSDLGYMIAGCTNSFGSGDIDFWLIKTNTNGDTVWTKTYGGGDSDGAHCVQQTLDGGYIVIGYTESYGVSGRNTWLIKTDVDGDSSWSNVYGTSGWNVCPYVQQTNDGGYVFTGTNNTNTVWMVKTDESGIIDWQKNHGGYGGYAIHQSPDNGYIIAGISHTTLDNVYILRTDEEGEELWSKDFGGSYRDKARAIQIISDGGYIVGGLTNTYGAGGNDFWLIRIESDHYNTNGLVAYYPFNGNANDESGNGNNGTVYGASLSTDRFGNIYSAYEFTGIDSANINIGDIDLPNSFSISVWVLNYEDLSTKKGIIDKSLDWRIAGEDGIGENWLNSEGFDFSIFSNNGNTRTGLGFEFSNINNWNHIIITVNDNTYQMNMYINSNLVDTKSYTGRNLNDVPILIGNKNRLPGQPSYDFLGKIDDVRLYNRALSEEEILELYHENFWNGAHETGTVTDIDGNVYQTVKIGNQLWMAENLKVTHYRNGDPIPNVTDDGTWAGLSTGAYCNYNNNEGNVYTYGRLYNWYAVDDSRNIAPEGWHVPTDEEWKQLEMHLGMSQLQANGAGWRGTDEGGKMKEVGTAHWNSPNTGATNSSGFTALPGGYRYSDGSFNDVDLSGFWWSCTEGNTTHTWGRYLSYSNSAVFRNYDQKRDGFSVRCVKDYMQAKNIRIPDTSASRNELVTIPVMIDNPDSLAGAEFTIDFDPDILISLNVQTTYLTSGFTLTDSINNSTGRIVCALARANAIQSTSPGSLVDISFRVNSDAHDNDTCSLILSNILLSDENSIPISANVSNGLFTVIPSAQEPPVRIEISFINDTLLVGDEFGVSAIGYDQFDNPVIINPDWSVTGAIGTVNPTYGDTVTFTAVNPGIGLIIATLDTLSDSGSLLVCKKGNIFDPSDTTIDVRDAVFCLRISEGLIHASPILIRIADMNDDENIDAADALLIMYESLKRLMTAKISFLANTSQHGPAKGTIINSFNKVISVNITERTDICAASLSFTYDSTQIEIIDILPGKSNSLIVSNTQKAGKASMSLINTDGLINKQDQLIRININSKGSAKPELILEEINIYDAKAEAVEIEEIINTDTQEFEMPTQFSIYQNYPNPFNPTTTIRYDLPEMAKIKIEIYNILGAKVRTLVSSSVEAGSHKVIWNGKNDFGYQVSSGLYIYQIQAIGNNKSFINTKTMLLIK